MFYTSQLWDGLWYVSTFTSAPRSAHTMTFGLAGHDTKEAAEAQRHDMVRRWAEAKP